MRTSKFASPDNLLLAVLVFAAIGLSFINLEGYLEGSGKSGAWYDEGFNLQVARNIALHGQYASSTAEGLKEFDPKITTGPTVILPIAALFKIFGVSITYARVVMAAYILLTLGAFYALCTYVYNKRVAAIATALFMFSGAVAPASRPTFSFDPFINGRYALGEIPALFFFLGGGNLWLMSLSQKRFWLKCVAGILIGMAVLTKTLFFLGLISLLVTGVVGRYMKLLRTQDITMPLLFSLLPVLVWLLYPGLLLGLEGLLQVFTSTGGFVWSYRSMGFMPSPTAVLSHIRFMTDVFEIHIWLLPAYVYVLLQHYKERGANVGQGLLLTFVAIWMSWWMFSAGWPRFAIPAVAVGNMFIAKFLYDLSEGFRSPARELWAVVRKRPTHEAKHRISAASRNFALVLLFIGLVYNPTRILMRQVVREVDESPYAVASFLATQIPQDAIVNVSDWELDFLTGRPFYHARSVGSLPPNVDYIVVGPMGKKGKDYPAGWLEQRGMLLAFFGSYDVYQVREQ